MLECDFCGCYTPKPGKGWVAYLEGEPTRIDEQAVATLLQEHVWRKREGLA